MNFEENRVKIKKSRIGHGKKIMVKFTCNEVATNYRHYFQKYESGVDMINRIGEAREKLGFTQAQVSMITGIKRQSISDYELGKRLPNVVNLLKISKALRCHADELLVLEEKD